MRNCKSSEAQAHMGQVKGCPLDELSCLHRLWHLQDRTLLKSGASQRFDLSTSVRFEMRDMEPHDAHTSISPHPKEGPHNQLGLYHPHGSESSPHFSLETRDSLDLCCHSPAFEGVRSKMSE
ncbi:hypothetical protein MPTK1_5g19040 [Marchantia polymorpha subsp. ruderalis]|uniref:Uncharacterized protein n=2 Tax=Marchantia polymorpha TaxID=3197 RepID=A0AAF6BJX8_MARPO|nr:hypothetical protein MARPO_0073s0039 [Marchantia polymorpha]BBN12312.1 hypothetical protein Mp_5g19040 [Marchantia polymorpha subsp. ruderalis]|eukprot:PTQ35165.1 hypothetical protein MARPO_0073s0039 [Marchantia polymorpha]